MEGRYATWGKEVEHPEVLRVRKFGKSIIDLIKHDPVEEERLAKIREEEVNKKIKKISNHWIKVILSWIIMFGIITVYIANM